MLLERLAESREEILGALVGQVARLVEQTGSAADIGLGLPHYRHVEKCQRLAQVMVGAETADGAAGPEAGQGAAQAVAASPPSKAVRPSPGLSRAIDPEAVAPPSVGEEPPERREFPRRDDSAGRESIVGRFGDAKQDGHGLGLLD